MCFIVIHFHNHQILTDDLFKQLLRPLLTSSVEMDGTVDDLPPKGKEEIYPVVTNTDSKRGNCEWFSIEASTPSFPFQRLFLLYLTRWCVHWVGHLNFMVFNKRDLTPKGRERERSSKKYARYLCYRLLMPRYTQTKINSFPENV